MAYSEGKSFKVTVFTIKNLSLQNCVLKLIEIGNFNFPNKLTSTEIFLMDTFRHNGYNFIRKEVQHNYIML